MASFIESDQELGNINEWSSVEMYITENVNSAQSDQAQNLFHAQLSWAWNFTLANK